MKKILTCFLAIHLIGILILNSTLSYAQPNQQQIYVEQIKRWEIILHKITPPEQHKQMSLLANALAVYSVSQNDPETARMQLEIANAILQETQLQERVKAYTESDQSMPDEFIALDKAISKINRFDGNTLVDLSEELYNAKLADVAALKSKAEQKAKEEQEKMIGIVGLG